MLEFVKRQFCRAGLHRWGRWTTFSNYQERFCLWCNFCQEAPLESPTLWQSLIHRIWTGGQ